MNTKLLLETYKNPISGDILQFKLDDFNYYKWMEMQTDRFFDSETINTFTSTNIWKERTVSYGELIKVGKEMFYSSEIIMTEESAKKYQKSYNSLLRERIDTVVPGVGPQTFEKLSKYGIVTVENLIDAYNLLERSGISKFSAFCLFLRHNANVAREVYFTVALFTHIVYRFKFPKTHEKQD